MLLLQSSSSLVSSKATSIPRHKLPYRACSVHGASYAALPTGLLSYLLEKICQPSHCWEVLCLSATAQAFTQSPLTSCCPRCGFLQQLVLERFLERLPPSSPHRRSCIPSTENPYPASRGIFSPVRGEML